MIANIKRNRRAGTIAAMASVAWGLQSLTSLVLPDPTAVLDITMIVPMTLATIGVWQLRQLGFFGCGKLGAVVAALCVIVLVAVVPGQIGMAAEVDWMKKTFLVASTAGLVGMLVLGGIALLRVRVAPRWMGIALIVAQPLAVAFGVAFSPISPISNSGDYSGALGHGIVWGLIGAALLGKRIPMLGSAMKPDMATAQP